MADQDRTGYDVHDDEGNLVRPDPEFADVGESPEDRETIIRFEDDPRDHLVPALLSSGEVNPVIPPDTLLGHLGNVIQVLEGAILSAEPRVDDGDLPTSWATMRLEEAVATVSRLRAIHKLLRDAFERQDMLDTGAHADNLDF